MIWNIDPAHTRATFSVRHMMISWVNGVFDTITGSVNFDHDDPASTTVDVQIEAASINTQDEHRDEHLKSADFLDIEQYPHLSFKSKRVELLDDEKARLTGELTIKDITREVTLDVSYSGMAKSPWGMTAAGFSAKTSINRKDWDLTWNVPLETGGVLVGDTVNISIELEIIRQDAQAVQAAQDSEGAEEAAERIAG